MTVAIRYSCPHCGRRIRHHPELAGQLVICSVCKGEFYEPTDPLPGKAAERALEPMPEATRRLRVPEGNNPRHDLAILARRGSSDMRSITEIVEAVLLDENPPPPPGAQPRSDETLTDFGYASTPQMKPLIPQPRPAEPSKPAVPSRDAPKPAAPAVPIAQQPRPGSPPAARPAPQATPAVPSASGSGILGASLAGPMVRPLVSQTPQSFIPATVVSSPQGPRSLPKPSVPGASPTKSPVPAPGLAGVSVRQMIEEIRRRGLGVAMVTCDMAPMRNFEIAFSENMTREDALALLRKYLDSLREPHPKLESRSGLLKRIWRKGDEGEQQA